MSDSYGSAPLSALRLGFGAAVLVVVLECAYALALFLGLSQLETGNDPISDPYFTIMEVLILLMMPAFVVLAVAVRAMCGPERQPYAMAAVVFVTVLTAITSVVHASVLGLSRDPAFADMAHVFAFEWPSVVYVLDVLAWDFFFGLFAIFLAIAFERRRLEAWVRRMLMLSGALALTGFVGAALGDMGVRNIGIVGYVGTLTISSVLLAVLFSRRMRLRG